MRVLRLATPKEVNIPSLTNWSVDKHALHILTLRVLANLVHDQLAKLGLGLCFSLGFMGAALRAAESAFYAYRAAA